MAVDELQPLLRSALDAAKTHGPLTTFLFALFTGCVLWQRSHFKWLVEGLREENKQLREREGQLIDRISLMHGLKIPGPPEKLPAREKPPRKTKKRKGGKTDPDEE